MFFSSLNFTASSPLLSPCLKLKLGEEKGISAFTWIYYLSSVTEGLNWEGNVKTILLT